MYPCTTNTISEPKCVFRGGGDSKLRVHEFVIYSVHITILKRPEAASLLN